MQVTNGIPLIDMKAREGLAGKIVKACEEWGCFRVLNHGVSPELLSEMKVVCRSLFDLPLKMKQGPRYGPPHKVSPYLEGLNIYDMVFPGVVDDFCSQLKASPHQRETILSYSNAIYGVAKDVGGRVMEGYGLLGGTGGGGDGESGGGKAAVFKDWICQLQINKYNYSLESVGSNGAVIHSDPGFLTILQDDQLVNGLEVANRFTGEWVPVDPIPDTLVVIIGDSGRVWSNGRLCSVKHQVRCHEPEIRVSIATFVFAARDKRVRTAEELVDSEHPRLYKEFDFEEYRKLRSSTSSPTGGALELFRCSSDGI